MNQSNTSLSHLQARLRELDKSAAWMNHIPYCYVAGECNHYLLAKRCHLAMLHLLRTEEAWDPIAAEHLETIIHWIDRADKAYFDRWLLLNMVLTFQDMVQVEKRRRVSDAFFEDSAEVD